MPILARRLFWPPVFIANEQIMQSAKGELQS